MMVGQCRLLEKKVLAFFNDIGKEKSNKKVLLRKMLSLLGIWYVETYG